MKHVEQMRERMLGRLHKVVLGVRSDASMFDGNQDIVAMLKGEEGIQILADVTDFLMERLGHKTKTKSNNPFSKTRRAAKKQTRKKVASG